MEKWWVKPKRKYQKENQGWIIKRPNGGFMKHTGGDYSFEVRDEFMNWHNAIMRSEETWKQLYAKGYRAVKVEVKEIEEWG